MPSDSGTPNAATSRAVSFALQVVAPSAAVGASWLWLPAHLEQIALPTVVLFVLLAALSSTAGGLALLAGQAATEEIYG